MTYGPMQILVVAFEDGHFTGEVMAELRRLREANVARLVDLVFVTKDDDGTVTALETSQLTAQEASELGAFAGALIGLGAAGEEGAEVGAILGAQAGAGDSGPLAPEAWYIADSIPPGTSAAVAIIEHQWAIGLRDAIDRAGGQALADEWLHPSDLVAVGEQLAQA